MSTNGDGSTKRQDLPLPPVSGYPDEAEALRRNQELGMARPAQKVAAETGAANELSDILSGIDYPADRDSILDFLDRSKPDTRDFDIVVNAVRLLPKGKQYRSPSEIAADLGNINEEYNRTRGSRR